MAGSSTDFCRVQVACLKRLIEGISESITGRRMAPAEAAVAEDPGQYENPA